MKVNSQGKKRGWMRLYIVVCVVWGLFIATSLTMNWPGEVSVGSKLKPLNAHNLEEENSFRKIFGDAPLTYESYKLEYDKEQRANREYEEDVKQNLPTKRIQVVFMALAIWIFGSTVFFVVPWVIAWVYRGFSSY